MKSMSLYVLLGFCLTLGWVILTLVKFIRSPLRRVPGPFLARFTRLWLLKQAYYGTYPKTSIELHKKYGPVVRVAPNEYSIDDPAAAKIIYGSGRGFTKSPWYYASGNPISPLPNIFVEPNPHIHAQARRKVAAAYSMTNLVQLEPFIDKCSAVLRDRLEEFARSGNSVEISHWMQCYAFDVIGMMTLGKRFGFLDSGEDIQGIMSSLSQYLVYCANVGVFPERHKTLFRRQMRSKTVSGLSHVREFANTQLEEKREKVKTDEEADGNAAEDFVTKFLRLQAKDPGKITNADISSVCNMNIGAGSDTTSISLTSIIFNLIKYPGVLQQLRAEIQHHESRGTVSDPITFAEANKLPYLQAVIKEGLRMHPATGLSLGRVVPSDGATLAGQYFPPGTVVGINAWVAHANTKVFGHDAHLFRPERWLDYPEPVKEREAYFMTFGQGSRTCLGKNISLMELSKAVPQIVRHFDFAPDTESGEPEYVTENVWFVKIREFHCKVYSRHTQ
ncbi:cytochrome P450 monooxygenase oxidoreductase [Fusarium mundagurra]|uniref:Cytochrome P450 monooxygenase oxidoreductase n=1 Tax=Fusarium mundagurra TaxID=1567541 RepID=A0A8H6D8Q9_9HYPO|nr:cytochrome P450 monooxygenase oxidoreductase [Fusarium mundagurra]